jgi:AraC-like DNA-binding protein
MPAAYDSLSRARELIEMRYFEPLDVRTLARAAELSGGHFIREFHRTFGRTPRQYLIDRRMQRAAELLTASDATIADICRAVGLRSVGSFTTRFTRTFGMPPTNYRALHRRP